MQRPEDGAPRTPDLEEARRHIASSSISATPKQVIHLDAHRRASREERRQQLLLEYALARQAGASASVRLAILDRLAELLA